MLSAMLRRFREELCLINELFGTAGVSPWDLDGTHNLSCLLRPSGSSVKWLRWNQESLFEGFEPVCSKLVQKIEEKL